MHTSSEFLLRAIMPRLPVNSIRTNRDMILWDTIYFSSEYSGDFDSHPSAPRRGVFCVDNDVLLVVVSSDGVCTTFGARYLRKRTERM